MIKNKNNESWISFSQNYLDFAELGCREMIKQKYKMFDGKNKLTMPAFSVDRIFIPTTFSIKHGIESYIKTLMLLLGEKYGRIHNSKELFCVLKNKINLNTIKKQIKEKYKQNKRDQDLSLADMESDFSDEWLNNLENLVDKYQNLEFLRDKIENNYKIEDTDNTVFRYPDNSLSIVLDYPEIVSRFDEEDIKKILTDIYELKNSFNSLGYLIDVYQEYCL